ncbi:MAG: hypothetical protein ACR2QM_18150 [Longimicrobiales bacterium]
MVRINPFHRERIQRNYAGGDLSCEDLLELLERKISPRAHFSRTKLVRELARARHRNLRAHTTGSDDKTMHYTVFVRGTGYHLRLDAKGVVYQITDGPNSDLSSVPPWVRPGGG